MYRTNSGEMKGGVSNTESDIGSREREVPGR
jgi:hypothetical protein